ncbi:prepilin peptidase [Blastococcus mobilis]|uniref:Leader peptidase (Prepilin peptidase) / N-methyltransferase n=1 Tax=Blastococcus mobilis TaxID=1938746 RepID=A0A238Y6R0_9ACTN|nr:A24 family peptidase [Blastococcus mobilis]SNR66905.1 leader peptidase (prepilin peptidase) / N-methyltransferase [Blastococcus mobilis]
MVTALVVVAGALGLVVGHLLNHAAGRFPWPDQKRAGSRGAATPTTGRLPVRPLHDCVGVAVRGPAVDVGAALLFVLATLRFGPSWELPAFLFLAAAGVLLAVIDFQHHLLPNRVVVPSIGIGAVLLLVAAVAGQEWAALLRAVLGAVILFAVFLVLALISPHSLGMGDVKLSGLLGLYLGWLGWGALVVGAAAGFVIQALFALVLLAGWRIGLRGELPFGPAMLAGAVLAIGWSDALLS